MQLQHTLGNAVQIIRQRRRDVGGIKRRLIGIADDGTMGIVASDDDKAMLADIENEERPVLTRINELGRGALKGELRRGELLCRSEGKAAVDGFGLKVQRAENQHKNKDKKLSHFQAML